MSLTKSTKGYKPMLGEALLTQDPFFSDLLDTRRSIFNLNRIFNGDFDFSPAINVKNEKDDYQIEFAAPGLSKDDFEITIDNGMLTVSAEKEETTEKKEEDYVRKEFSYNSFSRSINLPDTIDIDQEIDAKYKNGVLKLKLLKKEESKSVPPKKVMVS